MPSENSEATQLLSTFRPQIKDGVTALVFDAVFDVYFVGRVVFS